MVSLKDVYAMLAQQPDESGVVDIGSAAIAMVSVIVTLIIAVIVAGKLTSSTADLLNESDGIWYNLLQTIGDYGGIGITFCAIGLIIIGASVLLGGFGGNR